MSEVTVSIRAAMTRVASPITSSPDRMKVGPVAVSTTGLMRITVEKATASRTPLISAETGAGAWPWASANQVWNGNRPALAP
ncbi:Uncharacterised protein [Mycobacterium tuberculosis]|nr:Uncharacterised protein [Mycobacterium tuberculosis]